MKMITKLFGRNNATIIDPININSFLNNDNAFWRYNSRYFRPLSCLPNFKRIKTLNALNFYQINLLQVLLLLHKIKLKRKLNPSALPTSVSNKS